MEKTSKIKFLAFQGILLFVYLSIQWGHTSINIFKIREGRLFKSLQITRNDGMLDQVINFHLKIIDQSYLYILITYETYYTLTIYILDEQGPFELYKYSKTSIKPIAKSINRASNEILLVAKNHQSIVIRNLDQQTEYAIQLKTLSIRLVSFKLEWLFVSTENHKLIIFCGKKEVKRMVWFNIVKLKCLKIGPQIIELLIVEPESIKVVYFDMNANYDLCAQKEFGTRHYLNLRFLGKFHSFLWFQQKNQGASVFILNTDDDTVVHFGEDSRLIHPIRKMKIKDSRCSVLCEINSMDFVFCDFFL